MKEMGIPDHMTCLLKNLHAAQEATVKTGYGTTDWFQIGKGAHQGCILSPCLFKLYAKYILRNAGLDEAQAGIKIAGKNINNLRYANDTTLMAESEEELKSLLMKVKEKSEKVGLQLDIQKTKIMASGPITSWQIDGETVETVKDFIFGVSKITANGDCSHEIKRGLLLERTVMTNLDNILKSRDIALKVVVTALERSDPNTHPQTHCSFHSFIGPMFNAPGLHWAQEYMQRSYIKEIFRMLTVDHKK